MRTTVEYLGQSHLGKENPDRHGKDVREGGTPDKPWQDQNNGVPPGVHLGTTWDIGVQEKSGRRRGQCLGAEENQGKLRGVEGGRMGVSSFSSPHG